MGRLILGVVDIRVTDINGNATIITPALMNQDLLNVIIEEETMNNLRRPENTPGEEDNTLIGQDSTRLGSPALFASLAVPLVAFIGYLWFTVKAKKQSSQKRAMRSTILTQSPIGSN